MQSNEWLFIRQIDDYHHNYKMQSMIQGAWRGLLTEVTTSISMKRQKIMSTNLEISAISTGESLF